jgi:hypothetical protein
MRKTSIKDIVRAAKKNDPEIMTPVTFSRQKDKSAVALIPIKDHLLRIQQYDPIGFLAKVMLGEPIPFKHIIQKDGVLYEEVAFMVPKMSERLSAAEFLAAKQLPTMHAHKIVHEDEQDEKNSFDDLVERAIVKQISQSN